MFVRILKDAHDAGIIDLRRRGDDFEVARAAEAAPVSEQVAQVERAAAAASASPPSAPAPRLGLGPRGAGPRGRLSAPPPELLAFGVVETTPVAAPAAHAEPATSVNGGPPSERAASRGRGRGKAAKQAAPVEVSAATEAHANAGAKGKRTRGGTKKTASRGRAKKSAGVPSES
jgi:hypothetical protein